MSPDSPTPPPSSRRPLPAAGLDARERGRLVLLGVGLLLLLGVMAGLYTFITRGGAATTTPPGAAPPLEGPPVQIVPLFPEDEVADVESRLKEKMAAFRDIVDGVAGLDPEPFQFLVDEVTSNARVMNLAKEGFPRETDLAALVAAPGPNRGRLLAVSGEILSIEREPFSSATGLVKEIRRGLLRDGKGRLVTFSWPVGNPLEPDPVAPRDGWARVQGVFYKTWPAKDDAAGGAEVATPHLVLQRRPERAYPPQEFREIDPAWLEKVHDATPSEMVVLDEDPLFYLLNMARTLGPEGFEAWAKAKQEASPGLRVWPPEDLTGRYKELLEKPDLYRLRPVTYTGFLVNPKEFHDIRPNPGNVERVWHAFLVDQDFAPAAWIYSHRSIADMGFQNNDRAKVDGIFLKRVAYVPAGGGKMMRASVLVATRIVPAPLGKQPFGATVLVLVVAFMLLLAGALGWAMFQSKRESEATRLRRLEKAAKKRGAGGIQGPHAPPPAPPPASSPPEPGGPA